MRIIGIRELGVCSVFVVDGNESMRLEDLIPPISKTGFGGWGWGRCDKGQMNLAYALMILAELPRPVIVKHAKEFVEDIFRELPEAGFELDVEDILVYVRYVRLISRLVAQERYGGEQLVERG